MQSLDAAPQSFKFLLTAKTAPTLQVNIQRHAEALKRYQQRLQDLETLLKDTKALNSFMNKQTVGFGPFILDYGLLRGQILICKETFDDLTKSLESVHSNEAALVERTSYDYTQ
jgi:hypothetical protein